jgi:DNA-binding beta-propeller fold protein YncE
MEDYKDLSLERIWGAIRNREMRAALWDIFLNRDYTRYAEVTGRDYSLSSWPLRSKMRLYIRKDVAAQLWDYGIGPSTVDFGFADPYEQNFQADLPPVIVIKNITAPEGALQSPRGLAMGPDGLLYVVDSVAHQVQVYQTDGTFVRSWGGFCDLEGGASGCTGLFKEPWGIAVAPDGTVYVADTWNHRIQHFTPEGEFLNTWGRFGQTMDGQSAGELGIFYGPRDVAISPAGNVYVTDTGNKVIQVFSPEGRYIGEFGGAGPFDGQFDEQVGLSFGPDGLLYVADTWNGRVQVFDENHTFLRSWTLEAWYGQSVNNKPYLAVGPDNSVLVTDPEMYRVLAFDSQGTYIYGFGQYGTQSDGMSLPTGIVVDTDGTVFVSDSGTGRILGFRPPGQ